MYAIFQSIPSAFHHPLRPFAPLYEERFTQRDKNMRFLNVFAYACGALALATGPVQPAAVEPDVAAPELDFEDAVLVSHG